MSAEQALQILSISAALIASGGISAFSLFSIPMLKSQPASRSLPMVRWLFSRGSHIFPTAGILSSSSFFLLTYLSLPPSTPLSSFQSLFRAAVHGQPAYFLAASVLCISIAPITSFLMIPTNFTLIRMNEEMGGTRSQKSAEWRREKGGAARSADASVDGEDDVNQWKDLSPPQQKTGRESSEKEDAEVRALLDKFAWLNALRAVAIGAGGVVGLMGVMA
ncbi:hypothetical protein COCSADRAFT_32675 [Bipolaris sorokiniana ND90Pr]|uniref:DUF4149 domain-containing protein n=1 Tax=Cochliobolus sativus (strain ND90Pr / ATCC 201652) TaxID=665912 RepID=M2TLL1_COCSN|nr:uncharacterized protein COCSADRAFT_32675 [Bipolaris sorokiniana ND90Pr]EMD70041.1 hypothetical protein COCSADRAFT_32675 [Bipolaris sorokiniana ND90Pr]